MSRPGQRVPGRWEVRDARSYTSSPFSEVTPGLMRARRIGVRALARATEIEPSYLSRVLRQAGGKTVSGATARRVALALGLPQDYFVETRREEVRELLRAHPELLDALYERAYESTTPSN